MAKCPKCNYERKPNDIECPRCGIVYEKYERYVDKRIAQEPEKTIETKRAENEEDNKNEKENTMKDVTACRHCKKEVARTADKCPHCGGDNPGFTKKQAESVNAITTIVTIVLLVIVLMWARSCWKAGDELEKAGRELMDAAEEMRKDFK